ncbi:hypothetical protein ACVIGA_000528 [Bradyrhizobium sp. USDA 3240]
MLIGHCSFGSEDANLLVSLLPQLVHVRGEPRLATLMQFVRDEFRERRPAREVILAPSARGSPDRGVALDGGHRGVAGSCARARRRASRCCDPPDA